MAFLGLVVLGYLLGSCPWGYWLVRLIKHEDIRKVGSGNIGATNVWRTYGRWLGIPVVLLDVLKGFVPAELGMLFVTPHHLVGVCAGAAAMLGHEGIEGHDAHSKPRGDQIDHAALNAVVPEIPQRQHGFGKINEARRDVGSGVVRKHDERLRISDDNRQLSFRPPAQPVSGSLNQSWTHG